MQRKQSFQLGRPGVRSHPPSLLPLLLSPPLLPLLLPKPLLLLLGLFGLMAGSLSAPWCSTAPSPPLAGPDAKLPGVESPDLSPPPSPPPPVSGAAAAGRNLLPPPSPPPDLRLLPPIQLHPLCRPETTAPWRKASRPTAGEGAAIFDLSGEGAPLLELLGLPLSPNVNGGSM